MNSHPILSLSVLGVLFLLLPCFSSVRAMEKDTIATASGPIEAGFIGHGSLVFSFQGNTIYIDPVAAYGDYSALPKADLILLTHEHKDHMDSRTLSLIRKKDAVLIVTRACADQLKEGTVMENGDVKEVLGIAVRAVPAYNLVHMRSEGQPFHPKGRGNGYVLTFGDKKVYVAGDTENVPEMKALREIDVAFLPMNLPYTMTPEMVADAAAAFRPKILYPYHYGDTDPQKLRDLLKDEKDIEVRVRTLR